MLSWTEVLPVVLELSRGMLVSMLFVTLLLRVLWISAAVSAGPHHNKEGIKLWARLYSIARMMHYIVLFVAYVFAVLEVITWVPGERTRNQIVLTPFLMLIVLGTFDQPVCKLRGWSLFHVVVVMLMGFVLTGLGIADWYFTSLSAGEK